jgi:hypothetical protein
LFAEVAGETGDFAGEGVVGVVVMVWHRVFVRRDVGENNFVIHAGILPRPPESP